MPGSPPAPEDLKALFKVHGKRPITLATELGVNKSTISNWQKGRVTKLDTGYALALAEALGTNVERVYRAFQVCRERYLAAHAHPLLNSHTRRPRSLASP